MADYSKMSDADLDNQIMEKQKSLSPYHSMSDEELDAAIHEKQGTRPTMGSLDAAKIQGQNGALFGLRPIAAGLGAAAGDLYGQAQGSQPFDLSQTGSAFSEARGDAIGEQKQAQADHPNISTAANIGGSLLTAPLLTAGAGIKGAVKLGTALGAANAAGSAESLPDAVMKTGEGMAGGAIGYGLAKTAGSAASNVLSGFAENKAFKASGAMLKDFRNAFNREPDKINELGRTMLDNGLVKAGDTVKSIAQKSDALKRETGQQIGQVYDKVVSALHDPTAGVAPEVAMQIHAAGFHPEMQADEMKAVVRVALKGSPGATSAINKANTLIDELAINGDNIAPQRALELKGEIDGLINWGKKAQELPTDQEAMKIVRNYIQTKLNNQVEMLDKVVGSKQSADLVKLNRLYGNVSTIAEVAKDRVLRDSANQSFGLGDKMGGGIGAILGVAAGASHGEGSLGSLAAGAALAGGGALANKAARTYGNAAVAAGADSLGRAVANPATYAPAFGNALDNHLNGPQMQGSGPNVPRMSTTIKARKPAGR